MDKPEDSFEKQKKTLHAFARYSGMAFQIAGFIVAGVFFGKWLDKLFPRNFPLFTTIFTIIGLFAGVFLTIRDILKEK